MKGTPASALSSLVKELLAIGDPDELLSGALKLCRNFVGADEVAVALVEGDELVEHEIDGTSLRQQRVRLKIGEQGLGGWVAAKKKPLIVPDVKKDRRYVQTSAATRSEALIPLLQGDDLVGVLNFESSTAGFFKAGDLAILELLASQVAIGLRLERARRREVRLAMEIGVLNNIGRAQQMMEPPAFLQRVVDQVRRAFDCGYTGVFAGDYRRECLVLLAQSSAFPLDVKPGATQAFGKGLFGETFKVGETVHIRDVRKHAKYVPVIKETLSELDVPIRAGDRCIGLIDAQSPQVGAFSEDEVEAMETLARFLVPTLQTVGRE